MEWCKMTKVKNNWQKKTLYLNVTEYLLNYSQNAAVLQHKTVWKCQRNGKNDYIVSDHHVLGHYPHAMCSIQLNKNPFKTVNSSKHETVNKGKIY